VAAREVVVDQDDVGGRKRRMLLGLGNGTRFRDVVDVVESREARC